jgi:hypothetical protein
VGDLEGAYSRSARDVPGVEADLYGEAWRYFGQHGPAPRHPKEFGSLWRDPGEYFDRVWRGLGLILEDCEPEERRAYRDRRAHFVERCRAFALEPARGRRIEGTARAAHGWAEREHAAGQRVWGARVPAEVLPDEPPASVGTGTRARGAGRPAARAAQRSSRGDGGDSGPSDEPDLLALARLGRALRRAGDRLATPRAWSAGDDPAVRSPLRLAPGATAPGARKGRQ